MGDYSRKLDAFGNVDISTGYTILAATDYTTPQEIVAAVAGWTIYIQKILVAVSTDNAATQQFEDDATTPLIAAKTKASPGIGPIEFDFGPDGFPLTEGKALMHRMSATGMAASITITGYRTPTSVNPA
jgi:hypothetical protein